ncbi:hypothetical protein PR048_023557 [Dryococelus australis]|uniref:Uncharacterized protein n=1 Tax=Dryococelus australis TaxID=614101 RepID=A0ABQ9GUF8_9NEOP|nr:hypothetical protein PR048_023557 [Dryococelus australis]
MKLGIHYGTLYSYERFRDRPRNIKTLPTEVFAAIFIDRVPEGHYAKQHIGAVPSSRFRLLLPTISMGVDATTLLWKHKVPLVTYPLGLHSSWQSLQLRMLRKAFGVPHSLMVSTQISGGETAPVLSSTNSAIIDDYRGEDSTSRRPDQTVPVCRLSGQLSAAGRCPHWCTSILYGATVAERLDYSPPTKAIRVESPAGIVPDDAVDRRVFSGISRFPALSFQRCSILTSIILIGSQDPDVKSPSRGKFHGRARAIREDETRELGGARTARLDHEEVELTEEGLLGCGLLYLDLRAVAPRQTRLPSHSPWTRPCVPCSAVHASPTRVWKTRQRGEARRGITAINNVAQDTLRASSGVGEVSCAARRQTEAVPLRGRLPHLLHTGQADPATISGLSFRGTRHRTFDSPAPLAFYFRIEDQPYLVLPTYKRNGLARRVFRCRRTHSLIGCPRLLETDLTSDWQTRAVQDKLLTNCQTVLITRWSSSQRGSTGNGVISIWMNVRARSAPIITRLDMEVRCRPGTPSNLTHWDTSHKQTGVDWRTAFSDISLPVTPSWWRVLHELMAVSLMCTLKYLAPIRTITGILSITKRKYHRFDFTIVANVQAFWLYREQPLIAVAAIEARKGWPSPEITRERGATTSWPHFHTITARPPPRSLGPRLQCVVVHVEEGGGRSMRAPTPPQSCGDHQSPRRPAERQSLPQLGRARISLASPSPTLRRVTPESHAPTSTPPQARHDTTLRTKQPMKCKINLT